MITLLINTAIQSQVVEILGYISAVLESGAALFVIILKAITIFKAKDLKTKDKIKAFNDINVKKK